MTAKNKPTYELFCKGIMNKSRKGVRFDADGNVIVEPKAEFGSDVEVDGQLTINSASDLKTKDGTGFASKSDLSNLATKEELNAKQSTLYRHTVIIATENNNNREAICISFTAESEKNLEIDSFQDLVSVFGNTELSCSGMALSKTDNSTITKFFYTITVGTSLATTTFIYADIGTSVYTEGGKFTDIIGKAGFVIFDTVTAM